MSVIIGIQKWKEMQASKQASRQAGRQASKQARKQGRKEGEAGNSMPKFWVWAPKCHVYHAFRKVPGPKCCKWKEGKEGGRERRGRKKERNTMQTVMFKFQNAANTMENERFQPANAACTMSNEQFKIQNVQIPCQMKVEFKHVSWKILVAKCSRNTCFQQPT